MSAGSSGFQGTLDPSTTGAELNTWAFIVGSILSRHNTATLVEVLACTNNGELSPVGFVDVQMMVNQIDGLGNATPNAIVYHLPYLRYQGGTDAVILDPKPGDIGVAVFASRDISTVKATKAVANPGSRRQFDLADGMYLGGMLNGTPGQFVRFHPGGIEVVTPGNLQVTVAGTTTIDSTGEMTLIAPHIIMDTPLTSFTGVIDVENSRHVAGNVARFNGDVEMVTGTLTVDVGAINVLANDITAQTISLLHHLHSGVQPGGGDTGQPVP